MGKEAQVPATDGLSDDPEVTPKLELTPRELAIARDEDPDAEAPEVDELDDDQEPPEEPEVAEEPADDWRDDFTREMAAVHGLSDEDLDALGSREAFTGLLKYLARYDETNAPAEPAAAAKVAKPAEPEADDDSPVDKQGMVNVAYYRAHDYDDATIAGWESVRKLQEEHRTAADELKGYKQQQAEAENFRLLNAVHDTLDAMRPEFYGLSKDGETVQELKPEFGNRRQKVYDKANVLQAAYRAEKQPVPTLAELLAQAEQLAFGKELTTAESAASQQDMTQRIARQSRKRRPVASSAGIKGGLRSPDEDPYSTESISKKLAGKWREIEDANGSR